MIIPVGFTIQREDAPESFVLEPRQLVASASPAGMRITFAVFDTEARVTRGFSARVQVDPDAQVGHELGTLLYKQGVGLGSEGYLRALRAGIDELLGEEGVEVERVEPQARHRGPRVRVRGYAVDEDSDERGDYVEVEAGPPEREDGMILPEEGR